MSIEHSIRSVKMPDEPHLLRKKWWEFCWWCEENNPFTKFIYVNSAEEYMNMPRKDRTYLYFWYNHAIINGGKRILGSKADRDAIDTFLKYKFPIQYWGHHFQMTTSILEIILLITRILIDWKSSWKIWTQSGLLGS